MRHPPCASRQATPLPPHSPCACMQCEWRTLRGVGPDPRGGESCSGCPSPLAGEKITTCANLAARSARSTGTRPSRRCRSSYPPVGHTVHHGFSRRQACRAGVQGRRRAGQGRRVRAGQACQGRAGVSGLMRAHEQAPPARAGLGSRVRARPARSSCDGPVPARRRKRWGRTVV